MKRKKIVIILLIIAWVVLSASEKPQLARLHYDGGGDWYNDPDALPNLVKFLNKNINTDFSIEQAEVKPSDSKLFEFPFIYMTGHGNIAFSEKDAENLREYLLRGGFLYADDDYGMNESFRREIKKVFPDKELVELPANHAIYHCYYDFPQGLPKIHKHDDQRPQAFAIFDENGMMLLLYTYETNISDGWSNAHDDPAEIKKQAFQMGANLFYYLMTM
ncbi:MAG TPA: DUF4159 domain-containing protein [Candidatus Cloacimonetes bacterium]|nr:DUF4159 domain-containing protein [Candidatus Cloacimonadota bacterium]